MRMGKAAWCAAIALCLSPLSGIGAAQAQNKTVTLLSWGGSIQTMFEKEGYADRFKEATGYTVVLVPKPTVGEIMATAIAQKDKPQVDAVFAEVNAYMQGIDQGIFETLQDKDLPTLAKMYDFAKIRNANKEIKGIAVVADAPMVMYREDIFKKNGWALPKGFADLQRPELKGKVIVPPVSSTYGLYYLLELARLHGGSEKNIEPGFKALKDMAPRVLDWTTSFAQVGTHLESQEAAIAVWGSTGAWEIAGKGVPITILPPDPVYLSMSAIGIMKGAPNPEGARILTEWFMNEQHLNYRAVRFGETPLNRTIDPKGGKADHIFREADLGKVVPLDYTVIHKNRPDWIDRYRREIANAK